MFEVKDVTNLDMAFGSIAMKLMPKWEEIPDEFKDQPGTKWNKLFGAWFYAGLTKLELRPKKGVDKDKALRHIRTIMGVVRAEARTQGGGYRLSVQ